MEKRIIIAGSGGQGVLFLGKLIACTALSEGKEVTWFPSYGAEMRGGTANCTVVISKEMIGSPVISNTDVLIVMNEASLKKFAGRLLPGGLLIYDSSRINDLNLRDDITIKAVPATHIATSQSNTKSANMVIMGAFMALSGLLQINSLKDALMQATPIHRKKTIDNNINLIKAGYDFFINPKTGGLKCRQLEKLK
jgi:2-oxoglutarate ferredoxin oxidoreductase subunit gamma